MADVPSFDDLFAAGRREALVRPTRITRTAIDTPGTDANTLFAASAAMGEEVARLVADLFAELFLGTSSDRALDRFLFDRYQLVRQAASPAVDTLEFTRNDNSIGFTILQGDTFSDDSGVRFAVVTDVPIAQGTFGPYQVKARAVEAGPEGNVEAGTITNIDAQYPDDTLEVTNLEGGAGGKSAEEDEDFQSRGREFFLGARRGTKNAIEIGARATAGVVLAEAEEVLDPEGDPSFRGNLFISDVNGRANLALASDVITSLAEFRALGVPVNVVPAVPQYVDIVVEGLVFRAGANTTQAVLDARAAILAAVNGLQPQETLRRAAILAALGTVRQIIVPDGALVEPAGDLVPSSGRIIRTTSDRLSL